MDFIKIDKEKWQRKKFLSYIAKMFRALIV